jgi:hypothetical protein
MERKKTAAKRRGKPATVGSEREALAGMGPTAGLGQHHSAQSVCSIADNTGSSVRDILANCDHPIEEIIRKIFIPKLYAKETKFLMNGGKVEIRVVDDHYIQLKTALELAKMCGCYAAEKVEVNIDHTTPIDMTGASDDELKAILKIAAEIKERNCGGKGRILQAKPSDLASGG